MAVLEFQFVSVGANGIDNDINKINNNFKGLHGTIEQNIQDNLKLANQLKEVRQQLKETGNSNVALSQSQRELQQRYNDSNAVIRQQINAFDKTDGSLAQMRSSLSLANRAFDNLNKTAREGGIGNNLSKQIAILTQEISKAEQATGRFQRGVGNYQQKMTGANGVTMEFNRIIQDAPFGMMGVGNNIQQLAENWKNYTMQAKEAAVANGTTMSTMGLLRGAIGAIFSPINLLSLGISAVTSGWILYEKWQQKAKKATEEATKAKKSAKDALDAYVSSMSSLTGALLKGEQASEKELIRLKLLNDTYKNSNTSVQQRKNAYNEMISMYESYFGKLTDEQKKVFDLGKHYDQLTNAIIKTAKARALEDEMVENAKKLRALDKQRNTEVNNYSKLQQAQNDRQIGFKDALLGRLGEEYKSLAKIQLLQTLTFSGQEKELNNQAKINEAVNKWVVTSGKIADINKDNEDIYKQINEIVSQGAVISTSFGDSVNNTNKSLKKTTDKLKEAIDYLKELRSISGVSEKDISLVGKVGIDAEIAGLSFDFNEKLKAIQDFQNKVLADTTLTESKRAEIIEETNKTIQYLMGNASANMKALVQANTDAIDKMTIKAVQTYKDVEIGDSPKEQKSSKQRQARVKALESIIVESIDNIFEKLKSNLDEFGRSFQGVFLSIAYSLGEVASDLIAKLNKKTQTEFVNKLFKENEKGVISLKENWQSMTSQDKWSAGLGMAGSLVSSLSPKTSSGGQALGGALSGAAAGTALLPGIGTAVGAAVGAVGGLLSASKNKRQERIMQQQLEAQLKANALLERMNALSYASQIIGSRTEYGIVTGVNRNEFGEITLRVNGNDLVGVFNRTNEKKGR